MEDNELSLKKQELENEKLKIEVRNLQAPWHKKNASWQIIGYIIFGLGTIVLLTVNGAFEYQTKALRYERANLTYDINKLNNQKDSLEIRLANYRKDSIRLAEDRKHINDSIIDIRSQLATATRLLTATENDKRIILSKLSQEIMQKTKLRDSLNGKISEMGRALQGAANQLASRMYYNSTLTTEYAICVGERTNLQKMIDRMKPQVDSLTQLANGYWREKSNADQYFSTIKMFQGHNDKLTKQLDSCRNKK